MKAVALLVAVAACTSSVPAPVKPPAPPTDVSAQEWVGPPLDRGEVVLHDAYGGVHPVQVEIADSQASRTRGMMWRSSVPESTGMLFIFPDEAEHSFWMRNTLVPLDMLFLAPDGQVVGVLSQAEPLTRSPRTVGRPSLYVLEVAGGWAEKTGIVAGAKVELKGSLASRAAKP